MGKRKTRLSDIPMPQKRPSYRVTDSEGNEVHPGDTVTDFRGNTETFRGVSRGPDFRGDSAKVTVEDLPGEYYATVYGLTVEEVEE